MSLRTATLGWGSQTHRRLLGHFYGSAVVLMYHRIAGLSGADDPHYLCTPPELFAAQLDALCDHYQLMTLGDAVALLNGGHHLPEKTLCLTFDDGYLDNFTTARDLLERAQAPATFFVASAGLQADYHYSWEEQAPELYAHVDTELLAAVAHENELVEIGGHTHTHPRLAELSEKQQKAEITTNRAILTEICGYEPTVFAYPFGQPADFNETSVRLVHETGYKGAASTTAGILSWRSDRFRIRRIDVHSLAPAAACTAIDTTFCY